MIPSWTAVIVSLAYLGTLFAIAYFGDGAGSRLFHSRSRPMLYALGLCVYCTSWTFYGSVGLASRTGFDFVPIYLGPAFVLIFGRSVIARILKISKSQNITSIADFMSARYGKKESVAAVVAIISVVGVVPYIALQIKAISKSFALVSTSLDGNHPILLAHSANRGSFLVAALLALFTIAFGTRRVEATEHQDGLMLAIAAESVIKLAAFVVVGIFVTWGMFHGFADMLSQGFANERIRQTFLVDPPFADWLIIAVLSGFALLLLPRQFHAMIVENRNPNDLRTAAVVFPSYLVLINLFVVPIAIAGLLRFPIGTIDRDWTLLGLPLLANQRVIAIVAMVGGFSAAAAMVVLACVALSIMISNDMVIPALLRWRALRPRAASANITSLIIHLRRAAIIGVILLAYFYLQYSDDAALASIGLLSFAAIAQIGPSFIGGLFWQRANTSGALAGLWVGFGCWFILLFLPSFDPGLPHFGGQNLMFAEAASKALKSALGLTVSPLSAGALISLAANGFAFVALSLSRLPTMIERLQARIFIGEGGATPIAQRKPWQSGMSAQELEETVARYMGVDRARLAFAAFATRRGHRDAGRVEIDIETMRFAEQTLASVIGAASSRLVLSLALRQHNYSRTAALDIVDEASAAIRDNHNLLQHAIDFAQQGITVFDSEMRLVFWNREFSEIFNYPQYLLRLGITMTEMVRTNVARGLYGPGDPETLVARRINLLTNSADPIRLKVGGSDKRAAAVIEIRSSRMPEGGLVTTYTDVTQQVEAEEALAAINETLEMRVRERTDELTRLNGELARAKGTAEEANLSKTRFLAAASHDILQPLNAARLFATALAERSGNVNGGLPQNASETFDLACNVDASLEAVEEILTALLDMSRLDAGAMKAEISVFRIDDILNQLRLEFEPLAKERGLKLIFLPCRQAVRSDRRLLRRLLQNLVSNAIKYTVRGKVLVGCRARRGRLRIEVWDTGLGIPENKRKAVFREFERLEPGARTAQGLGLGLSIVERIARVLGHRIILRSWPDQGSMFAIETPIAPPMPAAASIEVGAATAVRHLPLQGMCVIAVDDEPRILEGMVVLLEGWGCKVLTALSMEQAEKLLASSRILPDAILADYHLGDELGIEVITQLRWKFGAAIPAILMTADRSQSVRVEAGLKDISLLHKPIKPAALRALLTQWRLNRFAAE